MSCEKIIREKDPQAILDYGFDWVEWLDGDTITASTWSITGPDGTLTQAPPPTFNTVSTTVWLTGGTLSKAYVVVNHITTTLGRQNDRTLTILIQNA